MNEISELRGALNEHLKECAGSNARVAAEMVSLKTSVAQLQSVAIWVAATVIVTMIGALGTMFMMLLHAKGIS